jgi:lipoprotein LprG
MHTRLLAIFAALIATVALIAGCSSSSEKSDESLPDATTLLKESSQTTRDLKSVHLVLSVNGEIADLPIKTLSGDLTNSPVVAAQGNATLSMSGSDVEANFVVSDGILYVALSPDNWIDMGPAADIYDVSTILNPDTGLANVLANFSDAKSEGTETLNGVEAVKVTGKVSPDAVNKIAAQIGATEPVPGTAWIRKDGNHELVQAQIEPTPGNNIQMTLSEWDKPITVTKPAV